MTDLCDEETCSIFNANDGYCAPSCKIYQEKRRNKMLTFADFDTQYISDQKEKIMSPEEYINSIYRDLQDQFEIYDHSDYSKQSMYELICNLKRIIDGMELKKEG